MATKELTDRQQEALDHLTSGKSVKEAAEAMGISYNAASEHKRTLQKKGALTKSGQPRGGSPRRQAQRATPVQRSNGDVKLDGIVGEALEQAKSAASARQEEISEEMSDLNLKQHNLAKESSAMAKLVEDIDQDAKELAATLKGA